MESTDKPSSTTIVPEEDFKQPWQFYSQNLSSTSLYSSSNNNSFKRSNSKKVPPYHAGYLHAPGEHYRSKRHRSDYHPAYIFKIGLNDPTNFVQYPWRSRQPSEDSESLDDKDMTPNSRLFPSMRILLAVLLCCCYITISISTSNLAVALICMIKCPQHGYDGDLDWTANQEGLIMAAQNAGSLFMLITGLYADRINGKWMVGASLLLCTLGNFLLPSFAQVSFWYAIGARLAVGMSDAFMSPSVNSLITRWFPHAERALAVGIITGGRQIGTLFILPTAGYLCSRIDTESGWPNIFYLSGLISAIVVVFWLPMGADKPAKQYCISRRERLFIESRIENGFKTLNHIQPIYTACEKFGKRIHAPRTPWSNLMRSVPLWAGVFSLVCHEFPLIIMLQFLPNYMRDVLEFEPTQNGLLSALPILFLLLSKTLSASLFSWIALSLNENQRTQLCKLFNAIASFGLAVSIACVPQFDREHAFGAVTSLCFAMFFAGLHTPGVQTALLQLAPAFTGVITGISFFAVSWSCICNKILTKWIVQKGTREEWSKAFYISAVIAALPIAVFTLFGSDKRQWWAKPKKFSNKLTPTLSTSSSTAELSKVVKNF